MRQAAGNASASVAGAASLADDDDMAQWDPDEDMAMTPNPGNAAALPRSDSLMQLSLDTAFQSSPQY